MCNKEWIVSYLYDDIGQADRVQFEQHLRACAACREELESLRSLRGTLSEWAPPVPDLDFRIVQRRRQAWNVWWTPALGLAAAAVLVLAVASAIAHVQITRDASGWTVRTGWGGAAAAPAVTAAAGPTSADVEKLRAAYVSLEQRLNDVETASRKASPVRNASVTSAPLSDAEVTRRVRDLLSQSESRQQRELALRISQVIHDVDAQRMSDLARIQQVTTQEAAAHRDLANYILTSSRQK